MGQFAIRLRDYLAKIHLPPWNYSLSSINYFFDIIFNGPARYVQQHHFEPWLTLVLTLGLLFIELAAIFVVLRFFIKIVLLNINPLFRLLVRMCGAGEKDAPNTFLELTFPADTAKSAFATEQLHILLQGLVRYYGFLDKLAARKKPYSLELVATHDGGIRYVLMIPTRQVDVVRRNLLSFLPGLRISQVEDYMATITRTSVGISELRLTKDFILPLQNNKALTEHDPIAYLTGHMTKLAPDELVAFQIVTIPVFKATHHRVMRRVRRVVHRIALGKEISSQLEIQRTHLGYL